MILVAGGQGDPSMAVLVDRMARRGTGHLNLLLGSDRDFDLRIDLQSNSLSIDGRVIRPGGCFIRHDVFLYDTPDPAAAHSRALNWYQAIRGWCAAQPGIRLFNRQSIMRENNKIENLLAARQIGLAVPHTLVTNDFSDLRHDDSLIQKPVAGGEYTALLRDLPADSRCPRFVQPRLNRPEMRVYRIGDAVMGFRLTSPDLDYRLAQTATLTTAPVPADLADLLVQLCDRLNLDFAAADFMTGDSGEPLFLELNSQPMFAAFDRTAEGRLSDAIIDYLEQRGA
ncbi:hypothetical protein [Paracoccus sp. S3-43]|uniref:ATP-grasp domain-containing protein n=1 Tax=Paracoccus sp. S3-43 TaxID=3030011 RepID=UPI0023AF26AF|nr:hypothetical protein [Paracoccus sp. S3-43]WEF25821.1 hypothetical protein PXD02_07910 [Paracoccus sp. S3-43]